jgi:hypothetical protein
VLSGDGDVAAEVLDPSERDRLRAAYLRRVLAGGGR